MSVEININLKGVDTTKLKPGQLQKWVKDLRTCLRKSKSNAKILMPENTKLKKK